MRAWSIHRSGTLISVITALFAASSTACPAIDNSESSGSAGSGTTSSTTGSTGSTGNEEPLVVNKVDLLLAIDNSRTMADKQQILALAVPDLVASLVNPPCVDPATGQPASTPPGPLDACPAGSEREYSPILDIHVGIVSSSLGGHGSDACLTAGTGKQSNDDKGRLVSRLDATMPSEVETYQGLKFLAWDPAQQLKPPGEADVAVDSGADANGTALVPSLREMVIGVGQVGCGYESQLESWYRFLVDPSPPANITLDDKDNVVLEGTDKLLLDQRKAFLRPDSALMIVMLSDENDCSIMDAGQAYFAAQQKAMNGSPFHLPAARAICAQDPGDECCFSCGQKGPLNDDGTPKCAADPTCKSADGKTVILSELEDNINRRCVDQKRRYGIDFLYPIDRYVSGLSSREVVDRSGQVVKNPIFSDLDPSDDVTAVRGPDLVFFAGVVGVPWQDIARLDKGGVPDLKAGLDAEGKQAGGFKSAAELEEQLPGQSFNGWDAILGDFASYGAPKDPFMRESVEPRSGINPVTGDPITPSTMPLSNKINGNEFTITKKDDLQYACIFPLVKVNADGSVSPDTRDCSISGFAACDCEDKTNDNPLCQTNAGTMAPTDQVRGKAYPGLRHLAVLRGLGDNGVVASICPAQLNAPADKDFGYRPAMASIIERLKPHLK